jgi:hypothetical protein
MKLNKISVILAVTSLLFFSSCGKKTTSTVTPTPVPELVELKLDQKPFISLTPSAEGHEINLKISEISNVIKEIDYELVYDAGSVGTEIQKGVNGTIKVDGSTALKNILLGTESCTNGCKRKYDEGVTGGNLILNFRAPPNQAVSFETPFALKTTAEIKKAGSLTLESFSVKPKTALTGSQFFIIMKNFSDNGYSVFSNGQNSLVGNYPAQ